MLFCWLSSLCEFQKFTASILFAMDMDYGAPDRTRTCTSPRHLILSQAWLPITTQAHIVYTSKVFGLPQLPFPYL